MVKLKCVVLGKATYWKQQNAEVSVSDNYTIGNHESTDTSVYSIHYNQIKIQI